MMTRLNQTPSIALAAGWVACGVFWLAGCGPSEAEKFRSLTIQINQLKIEKADLQRLLAERESAITQLQEQAENLRRAGSGAGAPVFEVDHVEILKISSGVDRDAVPGDDAVAVYFRPVDRDGDVLKRGGRITVKLFVLRAQGPSSEVGSVRIDDPGRVREIWYGKFWTNHYKVLVPLSAGAKLEPGQAVDVFVSFVEAVTGREFTARHTISVRGFRGKAAGASAGQIADVQP